MFDWAVFKSRDVVVHCKNDKEALNFINSATKAGLYFFEGTEGREHERYFRFDCHPYPLSEGEGCFQANIVDCVDASCGDIVLEWENYMSKEPTLKEQYFRTGYVVEFENGNKYIVLRDGDEIALANLNASASFYGWKCSGEFDDDLNRTGNGINGDIIRVYDRVCRWGEPSLTLIWERKEEVKEMTIEDVEKLVGSKVKIVGGEA